MIYIHDVCHSFPCRCRQCTKCIVVIRCFSMLLLQVLRARIWRTSCRSHLKHADHQPCKYISTQLLQRHSFSNCTTALRTDDSDTYAAFQPSSRLRGRICMITGGTSGIGFAIAERFLKEDAQLIILVGRSYERLRDAAKRLDGTLRSEPEIGQGSGQCASIQVTDRVSLLVGDVSEAAGSWMRELEREMVCISGLSALYQLLYLAIQCFSSPD